MQIDWIEKYLAHPSLEPDYRKGRSHRDFLTDLGTLGQKDVKRWQAIFDEQLPAFVDRNFAAEKIEPQDAQIPHVLSRVGEEWLKPEEIEAALRDG
jgi:lipoate-protein ligase A